MTVAALALLLLNDHVLKAAHGSWWTGKLSDVAGVVLAPALVGVLLALVAPRLRFRTVVVAGVASVGVGFVVVKTTVAGAAAASAAWTALAGPSRVLADPTDLLALPALALAAWSARDAARRADRVRGEPTRRTRTMERVRWGVLLPLALFATLATSQAGVDGPVQIANVGGELVVGVGWSPDESPSVWYRTADGTAWEHVEAYDEDARSEVVERVAAAGGPTTTACEPERPRVCYRAGGESLLVERSEDGGRTWAVDWVVPDEVAAELMDRYYPPRGWAHTVGVAVLETPDGPAVYAVNDGDGLAVRHPDGTWERLGFPYRDEPVVPLPGEPTRYEYALPWGLVVALAAALLVLGVVAPRRPGRTEAALGGAIGLGAPGAALGMWAVVQSFNGRAVAGQQSEGVYPILIWAATVIAVALLLGGLALVRSIGHTLPWALLAGIGAGAAWQLLGRWPVAATLATAAVCLLVVSLGRRSVRARAAEETTPGE